MSVDLSVGGGGFRFDLELSKVNDTLRAERQQRERIQKERDEMTSQKYTMEQELKVFQAFINFCCLEY